MVTFPFFSVPNGYIASKFYVFFNGSNWLVLSVIVTIFYPFTLYTSYCMIELINPMYGRLIFGYEGISSNSFAALWLFLCLPGAAIGAYNGFTTEKLAVPTK